MIRAIPTSQGNNVFFWALAILFLIIFVGGLLLFHSAPHREDTMAVVYATATGSTGLSIPYEVTTSELEADWTGGGDFDPKDKCPPHFFGEGFVVLCKKLGDGAYYKFLYHQGKKLLYRIDKEVISGRARIGLHWVESTRFNARYRIADQGFKGGKTVQVPNGKGGTDAVSFNYGQSVSKKRVQPGRELFNETHIVPDQCPEWWDILNFIP